MKKVAKFNNHKQMFTGPHYVALDNICIYRVSYKLMYISTPVSDNFEHKLYKSSSACISGVLHDLQAQIHFCTYSRQTIR